MVIRPTCLVLRDCDSLVGWLAIFTRFSFCDSNSPALTGRIVICLSLRDGDSLSWLDCLLADNYFFCDCDASAILDSLAPFVKLFSSSVIFLLMVVSRQLLLSCT